MVVVDAADASVCLDENRLDGRRVKVRWDRSPVEGMMNEPLRSF